MLDNGKADGDPIESQVKIMEQYLSEHSELKLVDQYLDNGYSGVSFERPQWERLMDDVKAGKIDCIIVKDFPAWEETISKPAIFWSVSARIWAFGLFQSMTTTIPTTSTPGTN